MKNKYLFTSESVSEGHPDKVCDQISDAILDAHLKRDPQARVAVETLATSNLVVLAGEVKSPRRLTNAEMIEIARQTVRRIGYEQEKFDWREMDVHCHVHEQSSDISKKVDGKSNKKRNSKKQGAGDQGIMFGYACNETPTLMPATLHYSHRILENLHTYRKKNKGCGLLPDAKSQVTLQYENDKPVHVNSVVVSTQHTKKTGLPKVERMVRKVLRDTLKDLLTDKSEILINHSGEFNIGGPDSDAGLTGRKIIVDTYGGAAPHGGGAFSGKDPSKVDRSAAYFARYLAKNVVATKLFERCVIQLSYAIGKAEPLSLYVEADGVYNADIKRALERLVPDMTPYGICNRLRLYKPIYEPTAALGHFGRKPYRKNNIDFFTWEKTDLAPKLKKLLK